jgi:hypothetical protein
VREKNALDVCAAAGRPGTLFPGVARASVSLDALDLLSAAQVLRLTAALAAAGGLKELLVYDYTNFARLSCGVRGVSSRVALLVAGLPGVQKIELQCGDSLSRRSSVRRRGLQQRQPQSQQPQRP